MEKYISLISLVVSLSSLFMGCSGFSKKIAAIQKEQEKRLIIVDKKIRYHEQELLNLQSFNHDREIMKRQIEELFQKIDTIGGNYSELQAALNGLVCRVEINNCSLGKGLSETKKHINELDARLGKIQEIEHDLQAAVTTLQSKRYNSVPETMKQNTDYNEFGYSIQWLRDALDISSQKKKSGSHE
ncbi:MAG: hypothetical protein MRK01_06965 [Candidatus Scalindua sp.]|nr:hypothetical protein [Candidatus Scalindua sp.]